MSSAIRTCVRLCPLNAQERASGQENAWSVSNSACLRLRKEILQREGRNEWLADSQYAFDAVFSAEARTSDVYSRIVGSHDVIPAVMAGVNCTLMAYGQTASGKTYTMLGNASCAPPSTASDGPGMVALAIEDVLQRARDASASRWHRLRMSCLEVYNETCNDMLSPTGTNLKLYERARGVLVAGLYEYEFALDDPAADSNALELLLHAAELQRHVGSTGANDRSSRSHLLCTLTVESWPTADHPQPRAASAASPTRGKEPTDAPAHTQLEAQTVRQSTLQLVDLAGSERRQAAGEGQGFEGAMINKSLLTLSTIIHRLADLSGGAGAQKAARQPSHLPYRDSKLTRLLQPCLGGPAHALIVATVRTSAACVDESLATLRFAVRAQKVINTPTSSSGVEVSAALLTRLSAEVQMLRFQLLHAERGAEVPRKVPPSPAQGSWLSRGAATGRSAAAPPRSRSAAVSLLAVQPRRDAQPFAVLDGADALDGANYAADQPAGLAYAALTPSASIPLCSESLKLSHQPPSDANGGNMPMCLIDLATSLRSSIEGHARQLRHALASGALATSLSAPATFDAQQAPVSSDAGIVDVLEKEIVDVLSGTAECIAPLLKAMEQLQRHEHKAASGSKSNGTGRDPGSIWDDRVRNLRHSRAQLCGQHDLLSHLVLQRY